MLTIKILQLGIALINSSAAAAIVAPVVNTSSTKRYDGQPLVLHLYNKRNPQHC